MILNIFSRLYLLSVQSPIEDHTELTCCKPRCPAECTPTSSWKEIVLIQIFDKCYFTYAILCYQVVSARTIHHYFHPVYCNFQYCGVAGQHTPHNRNDQTSFSHKKQRKHGLLPLFSDFELTKKTYTFLMNAGPFSF